MRSEASEAKIKELESQVAEKLQLETDLEKKGEAINDLNDENLAKEQEIESLQNQLTAQ